MTPPLDDIPRVKALYEAQLAWARQTDDHAAKRREALAAGALRAALERLVRVVQAMDLPDLHDRPIEEELDEALAVAEAALKLATGAQA